MNECILVVDDDPEIVGAIAITLEREGYRVLRAYNGTAWRRWTWPWTRRCG